MRITLFVILLLQFRSIVVKTTDPNELLVLSTDWGERMIDSRDVFAYEVYNQAVHAANNGDIDKAIELYVETLRLKPDIPEALINYSNLLKGRDMDASQQLLEQAALAADHLSLHAIALSNLGHLKHKRAGKDLKHAIEAEYYYLAALEIDPDFVDALFNYGTLLDLLGRINESQRKYELVLQLRPEHHTAALNLANCYFFHKNYVEALNILEQLSHLTSGKDKLSTLNNLGQVYRDSGDHLSAFKVFKRALEEYADDFLTTTSLMQSMRSICYWNKLSEVEESLDRNHSQFLMPYDALFVPQFSLERQRAIATSHASPWKSSAGSGVGVDDLVSARALRVMYLSFDFRKHPMGYLTQGLLSSHSKERFHTTAVSYGERDNSQPRRRIMDSVDSWVDILDESDVDAIDMLRELTPDIVVDLMAFTKGSRTILAASRPAPLLINYLGFPSSMSAAYCDYAMVDRVCVPPEVWLV